jgi:hypothetical protein
LEFYISNEETHKQNIRDGGLAGDFRLCILIPFKSWVLIELKMFVVGRSSCTEPTAAEHCLAKEVHNIYKS